MSDRKKREQGRFLVGRKVCKVRREETAEPAPHAARDGEDAACGEEGHTDFDIPPPLPAESFYDLETANGIADMIDAAVGAKGLRTFGYVTSIKQPPQKQGGCFVVCKVKPFFNS
jgi:hypothetical protein